MRFASRRAPVAKADGEQVVLVHTRCEVVQVFDDRRGAQFAGIQIAAVLIQSVRQLNEHAVPCGAVAPSKAPAACGYDAGQCAVIILCFHNGTQPFAVALFCAEVQQNMFGRKCRVGRPAVFLALRAVRREIIEIRHVRLARHLLQFVCGLIRAGETAALFEQRVHLKRCKQVFRRLRFGDAADEHITETVIRKRRCIYLFPIAAAGIHVFVDIFEVARPVLTLKPDIFHVRQAVLQVLAVPKFYALVKLAAHAQAAHTGGVDTEIVQITLFRFRNGDGL